LYPKVFQEYASFRDQYGEVWRIPSLIYWYGMKANEEFMVEIDHGKNILIRFLNLTAPYPNGNRHVYFKLNGQDRHIEVKDRSITSNELQNEKVSNDKDIGAPLQGKLISILVKEGQKVAKDDPLFAVEAMKMESTILAPFAGEVQRIALSPNTMVHQDDLILTLG
jgi:pyruvate carboxylase